MKSMLIILTTDYTEYTENIKDKLNLVE